MRQTTFTTVLLTLLMCVGVLPLQAQVTIDQNNFSAKAGFIDNYHRIATTGSIIPEGGANMVWDYSGIAHETATLEQREFHDGTNDLDFTTALHYVETSLNFNAFTIPQKAYREVSESGYGQIGSKVEESSFSITALSGGPDDILRFPDQAILFEGTNEYLRFPMNYQDQWTSSATNNLDFELTVAAFGLNQTSGVSQEVGTDNVEVIGYGQVIIPMEDGTASNPVEVLLMKTVSSRMTNYFLGGAPAPAALLNAFSLVQGGEVIDEPVYSFYRPGFSQPVLSVLSNRYAYRPQAIPSEPKVVINREDFPRTASLTETGYVVQKDVVDAPSEGVDQVWDYSFLTPDNLITRVYVDASNDPVFPDALHYRSTEIAFNGFPIPINEYETIDEDGWYEDGRITEDITYSITAVSGGADDVLRFPETEVPYGGRLDKLQFPVIYGNDWTQNQIENTEYELTVAAFGLNAVPGVNIRTIIESREVVGEGKLIIPSEDGSPSLPMDALLLKVETSDIDSVFLGGAPAPAALLAAFGLTQGTVTIRPVRYIFYTPDFASNVLNVNPSIGTFFYRPQAAGTTPKIIFTRQDFTRVGGFDDRSIKTDPEAVTLPSEGPNQIWDYSNLPKDSVVMTEYADETNNPDFPNALTSSASNLTFQGLPIPRDYIDTVDDEGWGNIGKSVEETSFPLQALTGGPNDVVKFIGGNTLFEERINRLQFPVTDQSNWTDARTELIPYELTVGAFGLDQVPGYIERVYTETHEAVGYGTLIIPTEEGTASEPIEALLLKVSLSGMSHYYLGGALAPEALTNAFGVTQGEEAVASHYIFYTPGFHINVMRININAEGEIVNAFYRPQAAATAEPINISHNRVCDVPAVGQSEVTVLITGGVGPYQVSGNFNGEVEEGESFIFIMDDSESTYEISVVDATGNESQIVESVLPCTKLPVELLAFEGEVTKEGNLLQWTTASELNNQFFTLSHSTDGQNFVSFPRIEGNGTASTANSYEFLHRTAPSGTTYYQLSQTDLDGTTKDLGVVSLQRGETRGLSSIEVYPTATKHQLNIAYNFADPSESATLNVYDMTGRVIKSQNLDSNDTSLQFNVNDLTTGTYILRIENGLEILATKFVKL